MVASHFLSCQYRSGMLEIWRPFGQYTVHTNLAKVDCRKSSVTSVSSQSMHRALMTSSSDSRNSLNQVALPIRANLPVLSAPENAWNAGKAFAISGPNAVHNGLIWWTPETIEIEVFFGNKSQLAMIKTRTLLVSLSFSGQGPCHLPLQSSDGDQGICVSLYGVFI